MSNYKFDHARKTKIKAGEGTFSKQVSNEKWKKMIRSGGKKEFKLLRGENKGQILKDVDLKKEVGKILKQRAGSGITGKELKMKLVRKVGMGFKDAETIARAATLHYYEPPKEGISPKDALRNVRASAQSANMTKDMAKDIKESSMGAEQKKNRAKGGAAQASETAYADRLGVEGIKHKATVGGEEMETGISDKESSASANTPGGGKASVDAVEHGAAASIGAGTGQKQEKKTKSTTVPQKKGSTQPVQISHGGGSVSSALGESAAGHGHDPVSRELPGGIYPGGLVRSGGEKTINFAKEIQKRKEAELGVNAADDEKTKLPSEGAADDHEEEDIRDAA